jgi:hypothetical protein
MRDLIYEGYQQGFTVRIYAEPEIDLYIDIMGKDEFSLEI